MSDANYLCRADQKSSSVLREATVSAPASHANRYFLGLFSVQTILEIALTWPHPKLTKSISNMALPISIHNPFFGHSRMISRTIFFVLLGKPENTLTHETEPQKKDFDLNVLHVRSYGQN